jgi:hypothetical protein
MKRSQPDYWHNTGNWLEGVRKQGERCSDIRFSGRDLKRGSPGQESGVLQNRRRISLHFLTENYIMLHLRK